MKTKTKHSAINCGGRGYRFWTWYVTAFCVNFAWTTSFREEGGGDEKDKTAMAKQISVGDAAAKKKIIASGVA